MNKIKYLFLFVLCVGLLSGSTLNISAQSGGDRILVAGKKPLKKSDVETLVEFHEWLFEITFTADEREKFQSFIEREYRRNAPETRRNADDVIKAMAQVRALDAEKREQVREMTISGYVADLRKTGSDDDSQFLLGIYERAQNGSGNNETSGEVLPDENETNDAPKSSSRGGANSGSLVGRWTRSGGLGGASDGTGKTTYNSGDDVIFEFFPDGTMQFIKDKNTLSITQCKITEMTKIPGRYSVSGDTVTMNLGAGTSVGTSSCEAKGNFKKKLSGDTVTKKFVVKELDSIFRPDRPMVLCLDGAKDDDCFHRDVK